VEDETITSQASSSGSGHSINVQNIISDSTAKWVIICLLCIATGYAVVKADAAYDNAAHAQQEADLAKYFVMDMETYLYKQGLTPPADPWRKPKGAKK